MKCIIFYHDSAMGYGRMNWTGEFCDAQSWFERNHDPIRVTYCGVVLEAALNARSN